MQIEVDVKEMEEAVANGQQSLAEAEQQLAAVQQQEKAHEGELAKAVAKLRSIEDELALVANEVDENKQKEQVRAAGPCCGARTLQLR
jgi:hypothetical protein